jgi:hypothetical protein
MPTRLLLLVLMMATAAACHGGGASKTTGDGGGEGGMVTNEAGVVIDDPSLPPTVVVVLEGGLEPDDRSLRTTYLGDASAPTAAPVVTSKFVEIMSGLPHPCEDTNKKLGTVTFNQAGDQVIITSSKTRARGTCSKQDPHTLICDWVGPDGKPSVKQKTVTYGSAKKPITGAYDKKSSFSCKPQ